MRKAGKLHNTVSLTDTVLVNRNFVFFPPNINRRQKITMHLSAAVLTSYLKDVRDTIEYVFFLFKSSRIMMLIYIIKIHS